MITLQPDHTRGAVRIFGPVPKGAMSVIRQVDGMEDVVVRGTPYTVTAAGILLLDTEAPYSVDLNYRVAVAGISLVDRLIQQNLMPTPTFVYGQQGWLPGTGRSMSITSDATAHSTVVGHVGPGSGSTPAVAPTYIGHVDTAASVNTSYTLTPPTGGGTAIATNDQMLLIHQQLSSAAVPSAPAGWTPVSSRTGGGVTRIIWRRKRLAGDGGVTVSAVSGSNSAGSVLWVRGATDSYLVGSEVPSTSAVGQVAVTTVRRASLLGHLTVGVVDAVTTNSLPLPDVDDVSGTTFRYSLGQATGTRSFTVATSSDVQAGDSLQTTVTYGSALTSGGGVDIIFQAAGTLPSRVVARAKTTELLASTEPYLLTGRVRYVTLGLWTWADVTAQGTWGSLLTSKPTWLDVRGGDAVAGGAFSKLFLRIVNPATDVDYVQPQQVLIGNESQVNKWIDFSALVPVGTTIPATAEIQLVHGNQVKEYDADWYLDEFGITPGVQRRDHATLYWFDGSTTVPTNPEDMLIPDGTWVAVTNNASISWAGSPGNSISNFYAPSSMATTVTTYLTLPEDTRVPSEPVLMSDPLDMDLYCWVGLLDVGELTHPARQAIFQIINRADSVANSQLRTWEAGEFQVITHTLSERERFLKIARPGRVLLWRNPETEYPENNWYLAIGDVTEARVVPNQRKQERAWSLPFVRVAQPVGIASRTAAQNSWLEVRGIGTWDQVLTRWDSWLDMLVDEA